MTTSASVSLAKGIGHNSVQVPHNGVQQDIPKRDRPVSTIAGAKFKARSFFRSTQMSLALADAGLIPAGHLVREASTTGLLRHRRDHNNERKSVRVAF